MLGLVFGKKNRIEDLKKIYAGVIKNMSIWDLQAALLTFAALTAEVNTLKESLEWSENELGRAKKQLEDKEGE